MTIPILAPTHREWYCPKCHATNVTTDMHGGKPHTRFHTCPKLGFLTAPMLPVGVKGKLEARVREDYIGNEIVRLDANNRPVMSVVTTRDNGQDCTVYAPTANAKADVPPTRRNAVAGARHARGTA